MGGEGDEMTHMVHLTLWVRFIFQRCLILLDGWDSCILIRTPHVDGYLKFHYVCTCAPCCGMGMLPFYTCSILRDECKIQPGKHEKRQNKETELVQ